MADDQEGLARSAEASALAELASCEGLTQTAAWTARWSAKLAAADAALVWTADPVLPLFICTGAEGNGAKKFLRRSVARESGVVHDLLRDHEAIVLERSDLDDTDDPWMKDLPASTQTAIAVPLEAEGTTAALLQLVFAKRRETVVRGRARGRISCATPRPRSPGRCVPSARPSACCTPSNG